MDILLFSGVCAATHKMVEGDQIWAESSQEYSFQGHYTLLSGHLIHPDY